MAIGLTDKRPKGRSKARPSGAGAPGGAAGRRKYKGMTATEWAKVHKKAQAERYTRRAKTRSKGRTTKRKKG